MEPITLVIALIAGVFGGSLIVKNDSPTEVAERHYSKLYRVNLGENFAATAFALKVKSGVKLVTAGHVCDSLMDPRIPKNFKLNVVSDDKSAEFALDSKSFKISGSTDLCVMRDLPDETPAFSLSDGKDGHIDVWSIGYPAGLPLSVVKGHVTGITEVDMPAERSRDRCKGQAYSWQTIKVRTFLGSVERDMCVFKANMLATTLTVAPGNSGSPAINESGKVIGVISALDSRIPAGFGVIVPVENLQDEIK